MRGFLSAFLVVAVIPATSAAQAVRPPATSVSGETAGYYYLLAKRYESVLSGKS